LALIYLIFAIILNTFIGIAFKLFEKFGVTNLQALVINYWTCVLTGCIYNGINILNPSYWQKPYALFGLIMGIAFFTVFLAISQSTLKVGISTTQVSNKLSLVIPVILAWAIGGDKISLIKGLGLLLAILAVIISTLNFNKRQDNQVTDRWSFILPIYIFLGSGFLDSATNYIQRKYLVTATDSNIFIIISFLSAAILSTMYLVYQMVISHAKFSGKSIIAGVGLGIPNYFSILMVILSLQAALMQPSALIPIINISVVLASSISAVILFKEGMSKQKKIGLALAILSIFLILIGDK
jgi:drug/metabolite transporter (DMT)-like permease